MEYEGQICRAPMERSSFMLPIMVGCSYNKCKFCNLFRHLKYRELSFEEIEKELLRVKHVGGLPKQIFLGDGSAFDLDTKRLLEVLNLINFYFPSCSQINMDATVSGILNKTDEELKSLYEKKVRHLYIGIESGLDDVLMFMKKDHNMEEAAKAVQKIKRHGYFFDAHIMTGVSGFGRGIENAHSLANFFNQYKPSRVINFSMFLHLEISLYKDIKKGLYKPSDELSNLKEEECLISLLGKDEDINYEGFHDFLEFRVRGILPKNRDRMLKILQEKIKTLENQEPIYAFVEGDCTLDSLEKVDGSGKIWQTVV
ncbi:MAG: radical SAM protein [Treponema sp.]